MNNFPQLFDYSTIRLLWLFLIIYTIFSFHVLIKWIKFIDIYCKMRLLIVDA